MIVANLDIGQPIWSDTGGDGVVYSSLTQTQGNVLLLAGLVFLAAVAWRVRRRLAERLDSATSRRVARVAPVLALLWSAAATFQVTRAVISTYDLPGTWFLAESWVIALTVAAGVGLGLLRTNPGASRALAIAATAAPFAAGLAGGIASPNNSVLIVLFNTCLVVVPLLLLMAVSAMLARFAWRVFGGPKRNPVGAPATTDHHQTRAR